MKIKEIGPRGRPWRPLWIRRWKTCHRDRVHPFIVSLIWISNELISRVKAPLQLLCPRNKKGNPSTLSFSAPESDSILDGTLTRLKGTKQSQTTNAASPDTNSKLNSFFLTSTHLLIVISVTIYRSLIVTLVKLTFFQGLGHQSSSVGSIDDTSSQRVSLSKLFSLIADVEN